VTRNRITGYKASLAERVKRGKQLKGELPPISERRGWVIADMFPETLETPPQNRHERRARGRR
jgi:hypothetical protein